MKSKKLPELKTAVNERRRPSTTRNEVRGWWEFIEPFTQEPPKSAPRPDTDE